MHEQYCLRFYLIQKIDGYMIVKSDSKTSLHLWHDMKVILECLRTKCPLWVYIFLLFIGLRADCNWWKADFNSYYLLGFNAAELLTTNKLSELACLALYLMYEKKQGKKSFWYPYIRELDRQRGRGQLAVESPILWTETELAFLTGSPTKVFHAILS